jgi:hypothetical protein
MALITAVLDVKRPPFFDVPLRWLSQFLSLGFRVFCDDKKHCQTYNNRSRVQHSSQADRLQEMSLFHFYADSLTSLTHSIDKSRLSAFNDGDSSPDRGTEIVGISDRPFSVYTHSLGDFREIDVRIFKRPNDMGAVDTALVLTGKHLELHHFRKIRTVVMHDIQERDAMMCSCPQNARGKHQITVTLNVNGQATVLPVR